MESTSSHTCLGAPTIETKDGWFSVFVNWQDYSIDVCWGPTERGLAIDPIGVKISVGYTANMQYAYHQIVGKLKSGDKFFMKSFFGDAKRSCPTRAARYFSLKTAKCRRLSVTEPVH